MVHDANFRPKVNIELISKVEALFLIIPQFATHIISERFNLKKSSFQMVKITIPIFSISVIYYLMIGLLVDDGIVSILTQKQRI